MPLEGSKGPAPTGGQNVRYSSELISVPLGTEMARMQFSLRENCCTARFQAWAPTFPPKGGNPFTGFTGFYWFYGQKDRPLPTDAEIL